MFLSKVSLFKSDFKRTSVLTALHSWRELVQFFRLLSPFSTSQLPRLLLRFLPRFLHWMDPRVLNSCSCLLTSKSQQHNVKWHLEIFCDKISQKQRIPPAAHFVPLAILLTTTSLIDTRLWLVPPPAAGSHQVVPWQRGSLIYQQQCPNPTRKPQPAQQEGYKRRNSE